MIGEGVNIIIGALLWVVLPLMSLGCFLGAIVVWKYGRFIQRESGRLP